MSVALPKVKEMISEMSRNAPKIPTWVLISFNDPDAKLVKKTSNVAELKKSLESLDYNGGGDLPEVALKGGTFEITSEVLLMNPLSVNQRIYCL